ncbi:MAG: ABC transporter ATP-binding protein [Desulfovibrio sp.]|nr:ABC transporter ATP-binding protein [Desulfovibrio sp.]
MNNRSELYKFIAVNKTYKGHEDGVAVFRDLNLVVYSGESLAVVGRSGSGKSTLLHLMGALDKPTSGTIEFEGQDMAKMSPDEQAHFRNSSLGFVFQFHHLLPEFSALENVAMPGLIAGMPKNGIMEKAAAMLERVGLADRMSHRPAIMSGGERQRVAIARALSLGPRVVLADEPTGNLDEKTGARIGDLLLELNAELGTTLVIVTHNQELAARMDRSLELRAGALYEKDFA